MIKILVLLAVVFLVSMLIVVSLLNYAFAQVDTAWVRRYNGPGNDLDYASAIAVDGSGNVYVTGPSTGIGTNWDYATIIYYANGDTAWVRRYNGPGNYGEWSSAIAVDGSGNVYVTGESYGSGTSYDYATIKYYANGDTAWVRRYNGPGNGIDVGYSITVDGSDNVYVTGGSYGSGTGYDYATIKYYANGDTAWLRRYNGSGNLNDYAYRLAVDGSDNVYVTGRSYGSGTDYDYATIKYYANGDTAWVRRYNGPGNVEDRALAITVDGSGNVYVTGYSYGSGTANDYATIKYYGDGDTAWVRRYNYPADSSDEASAIAVDHSGNVYVTGSSRDSGTDYDYATIKYYPNGDTAWVRRYNGPGNGSDVVSGVAVDSSDNVYVTGVSTGSGTDWDYATIKYYADGDTAWVRRYNGPGNIEDWAQAITVDGSGNVYVTGGSWGSGTADDFATIKYIYHYISDTLTIVAFSPVDLIVTDPIRDSISLAFNTIPGANYDTTRDWNDDSDLDDIITIPNGLVGDYSIRVVAEPVVERAATYSLGIRIDGGSDVMLVQGHSVPGAGEADTFHYNAPEYLRGDVNNNWTIELGDVVYLITYLYKNGPAPDHVEAGDDNCSGVVELGDIVYLITYLYKGGPPPSC